LKNESYTIWAGYHNNNFHNSLTIAVSHTHGLCSGWVQYC